MTSAGCGHGSLDLKTDLDSQPLPSISEAPNLNTGSNTIPIEDKVVRMIHSESYVGVMGLQFVRGDGIAINADATQYVAADPARQSVIDPVNKVLKDYKIKIARAVAEDPAMVESRRLKLEKLSGRRLTSWNNFYTIETGSAYDAEWIYRKLRGAFGVQAVWPNMKLTPTGAIDEVPDLSMEQGYLGPAEVTGGLNAVAAWERGVKGEGVVVLDQEADWNFEHEDYSLVLQTVAVGGNTWGPVNVCQNANLNSPFYPSMHCPEAMDHGTAIMGIINGKHNGHGINGFAPDARMAVINGDWRAPGFLRTLTDGYDESSLQDLTPGNIFLIEFGYGPSGPGQMPEEVLPDWFAAIEQATAYGVTVISGSSNGSIDLNDPSNYDIGWHNLATEDAGAIMVGASTGADRAKADFSNCGNRVNVFAWGKDIVTAWYPSLDIDWDPARGQSPPNTDPNAYFTNRFGGTSASSAMIAGAAALVQSYAKQVMGPTKYLRPEKMRQILVQSGIPATSDGGCNIGMQPRIDVAMTLVDQLWVNAQTLFGGLQGITLSESRWAALRDYGIGLICNENQPDGSDSLCPEAMIWPVGDHIGKTLDFDGDGRADLVSWTRRQWKIDFSSIDGLGAWEVTLNVPPMLSREIWPVAEDYNSDGRTDFAIWDKDNGRWSILFMNNALMQPDAEWPGWDWTISLPYRDIPNVDVRLTQYSRPVPGDYNGDGWIDLALQTSDGKWRIDFGGANKTDYGRFDQQIQYLTAEQLAAAPGWAYLPVVSRASFGYEYSAGYKNPNFPDMDNSGIVVLFNTNYPVTVEWNRVALPYSFGGNESVPQPGFYYGNTTADFGAKGYNGSWVIADSYDGSLVIDFASDIDFGGLDCHPFVADFDNDINQTEDTAVQCPDEFRIYLNASHELIRYPLGYNVDDFSLPGKPYFGSISYEMTQRIIDLQLQMHPNEPPIIPVDMISQSICTLPWSNGNAPEECR